MAAVLAAAFLAQEISYAAPGIAMPVSDPLSALVSDPLSFQAPVAFSDLKEIHSGNKDTLILHIQDAHTNLSGQQNLASMLDEIMKKYPVSLVLVEGSSVDSTLTPIKEAVPAETVKRVAKSLLMEGQIAGEEYLNLISDHPMKIMGIEDLTLYMKSVLAYAELVDRREAIEEYLREVQQALDKLKGRLYPQSLKDLEKEMPSIPGGNNLFAERFDKLFEIAHDNKVDLSEFKELEVLRGLKEKEKGIDFDAANMEQAVLVQKLGAAGLAEHLKNAGRIRNQRVAQYAVYREVADAAMNANVPLSSYPNFSAYGEYLKAFTNLNLDAVLNEETQAEDKIYASVLKDTDARLVRSIDRYTGLLKTAFAIKMSSDEFKMFELNEPDFSTSAQIAFLNRKLAEQGYFEDLLPTNEALEKGKDSLKAFYRSVADRDEAFIENTEKALAENKAKVAVLISGGYHTAHLKELFEREGYSYAVMTPVVSSETNQGKYEKLLLAPIRGQTKKVETVQGEGYSKRSAINARALAAMLRPAVGARFGVTVSDKVVKEALASAKTGGVEGARLAGNAEHIAQLLSTNNRGVLVAEIVIGLHKMMNGEVAVLNGAISPEASALIKNVFKENGASTVDAQFIGDVLFHLDLDFRVEHQRLLVAKASEMLEELEQRKGRFQGLLSPTSGLSDSQLRRSIGVVLDAIRDQEDSKKYFPSNLISGESHPKTSFLLNLLERLRNVHKELAEESVNRWGPENRYARALPEDGGQIVLEEEFKHLAGGPPTKEGLVKAARGAVDLREYFIKKPITQLPLGGGTNKPGARLAGVDVRFRIGDPAFRGTTPYLFKGYNATRPGFAFVERNGRETSVALDELSVKPFNGRLAGTPLYADHPAGMKVGDKIPGGDLGVEIIAFVPVERSQLPADVRAAVSELKDGDEFVLEVVRQARGDRMAKIIGGVLSSSDVSAGARLADTKETFELDPRSAQKVRDRWNSVKRWIAEIIERGGRSLDIVSIGFGDAELEEMLAKRGHRVSGTEIVPENVRKAQTVGIQAVLMDEASHELPFASDSQDVVLFSASIAHFSAERILKSVHQILRPGGRLMIIGYLQEDDELLNAIRSSGLVDAQIATFDDGTATPMIIAFKPEADSLFAGARLAAGEKTELRRNLWNSVNRSDDLSSLKRYRAMAKAQGILDASLALRIARKIRVTRGRAPQIRRHQAAVSSLEMEIRKATGVGPSESLSNQLGGVPRTFAEWFVGFDHFKSKTEKSAFFVVLFDMVEGSQKDAQGFTTGYEKRPAMQKTMALIKSASEGDGAGIEALLAQAAADKGITPEQTEIVRSVFGRISGARLSIRNGAHNLALSALIGVSALSGGSVPAKSAPVTVTVSAARPSFPDIKGQILDYDALDKLIDTMPKSERPGISFGLAHPDKPETYKERAQLLESGSVQRQGFYFTVTIHPAGEQETSIEIVHVMDMAVWAGDLFVKVLTEAGAKTLWISAIDQKTRPGMQGVFDRMYASDSRDRFVTLLTPEIASALGFPEELSKRFLAASPRLTGKGVYDTIETQAKPLDPATIGIKDAEPIGGAITLRPTADPDADLSGYLRQMVRDLYEKYPHVAFKYEALIAGRVMDRSEKMTDQYVFAGTEDLVTRVAAQTGKEEGFIALVGRRQKDGTLVLQQLRVKYVHHYGGLPSLNLGEVSLDRTLNLEGASAKLGQRLVITLKDGARLSGIELPPWISADTVQDLRAALSAEEFSDMSAAQKEQIIEIAGTLRAPWFESSLVEFQDLIRPVLMSDSMTREERSRWSARVERISALIRDLDDKRRQSTETADLSRLVALVLIGRPVLHGYQMSFYVNGRGPFAVNEAIEELWQTPNVVAFTSRDPASDMALVLTELAENAYLKGREKDPATPVVVRIENDSLSVTNPGKYPFDKLRRAAAKNGVVRWKGELIDAGYWEMIKINNNQAEVLTPAQIRDKSVISDEDIPGIQGLTVREDEDLKDGEKELGEHAGLGGSLSALMPKDWGAKTTIRNSKDGKFVTATITFKKAGARLAAKRKPADAVNPAVTLEAARKANDWEIFQKERFTANLAGSLLRSVPVKAEDTVTDLPIADLYPTQIGLNAVKKAMEEIKGRIRAKFGLTAPQALVIEIPIYADEFSNAFVPVRFVMDGHHRISDALSRGQKTIRARYIRIAGSRDSGVRSLSASYKIWYDRNKIFKDTAERWKKLTIDTESVPEGLYFLISFIWGQADPAIAETMRGLLPQLSEPEKDQYRLKAAELLSGKDAPAPMTPEAAAALVRTAGARLAANGADQRKDTKFRSAVDEAVKSIRDRIRRAARQTAAARRLLRNLKAGNPSDRRLLQALGRSLEDRDFVSRLEKAATPGRRVVIISHGGLKEDNTIFGEHDTNVIIAKRQELTEKLLRAKPISHGYKTDRFAADEEFTPERLKALQSRLDSDMKTFILETFPDKVSPHLKGLSAAEQDAFIRRLFRSSIGVSLPVMSAETVSIADFEAVQAAKNEGGAAVYSHDALQRRVNEGIKLAAVMGINEDRIPSAAEILEARTQMQSGSTPADERQAALIRLLNIADLLEYPDPTDLNAEMRERRRAVSALAGLFMRSDPRSPPSAADIEKAIEYLRTDVQDPGILEPGAFHIEAARSPDTLVSADASGFYAVVAAEKLKALFRFARSTRRPMDALTAAAEAENAVQEIKRKLVRDLKDSIERITGQPITHITRSSGDEITLLAPGLRPEHYSALGNASYEIGLRITVSPRIMGERKARMRHAIAFAAASAERIDTLLDAVDGDSVLKEAKQILDQPKRRGGLVIAERDPKTNWQLFKAYLSVSDGAPVTEFGLNLEGTSRRIDRPTVSSRSAARLAGDRNLTDTQRQLLERLSGLSDTAVMRALTPEDYQTLREMSSAMTYQHRSGRAGVDDTEEPGVLDVLAYYRAAYPELSSAQSGARLSDSSFKFFKQIYSAELTSADISAADKALALADRESRILLAQIYHAKVLKGSTVPFLLTKLGRNASVGFSADGSEARLYDRNGDIAVTIPLADVLADAVAALDKRPANTRVLNAQAAQVFEPAVQEGSLMRAAMKLMNGLRSSGQLSDNAVLLRFKMPANTEHRRLILSVKAFIQKMDANTFFEFSNAPELSDTVPAAPDLVRVDVDTAPSLEEGHRFLAIQPAADDAGAEEVLPYAATFIAAILIGRLKADAASESGSNLIGFFKRLTQENFSVDDLANYLKPSRNASYRSIKRLGKIAIDQFLGYAAAALRAIGSAA